MKEIKKSFLRSQLSFVCDDSCFENPKGSSMTVPNQSFSIQDILDKFTHGINLPVSRDGLYSGSDNLDEINETDKNVIDLTDLDEIKYMLESINQRVKQIKDKKNGQVSVNRSVRESENDKDAKGDVERSDDDEGGGKK